MYQDDVRFWFVFRIAKRSIAVHFVINVNFVNMTGVVKKVCLKLDDILSARRTGNCSAN